MINIRMKFSYSIRLSVSLIHTNTKHKVIKKTDKHIKFVYQKKAILEDSLQVQYKIANESNKMTEGSEIKRTISSLSQTHSANSKNLSLCFLNQGLESNEILKIRSKLKRLGINLKKIPLRLWKKIETYDSSQALQRNNSKKIEIYGDLIVLSSLQSKIDNTNSQLNGKCFMNRDLAYFNSIQSKPWLHFFHKQILNYLTSRSNFLNGTSNENKIKSRFIEHSFLRPKNSGKKNKLTEDYSLNEMMKDIDPVFWNLNSAYTLGNFENETHDKNKIELKKDHFAKIIYPWTNIGNDSLNKNPELLTKLGSSNNSIETLVKEGGLTKKDLKILYESSNWEDSHSISPIKSFSIDFVNEWDNFQGTALDNLLENLSNSNFHFLGAIDSQILSETSSKMNLRLILNSYCLHDSFDLAASKTGSSTGGIPLSRCIENTLKNNMIGDNFFLKLSPLNSGFLSIL